MANTRGVTLLEVLLVLVVLGVSSAVASITLNPSTDESTSRTVSLPDDACRAAVREQRVVVRIDRSAGDVRALACRPDGILLEEAADMPTNRRSNGLRAP